jgi:YegS/Rv2252/BmrU family lipid kinase
MTKLAVVVHEGKSLGKGPDALRSALADAGYPDPPWIEVPKSKKSPKAVRRLLDQGIDRLLVWGGDGTARRCISTFVAEDAKVELAILPAGTANLLANALCIPIDLQGAVEVALHGMPRPIDVGVVNGEAFAVMAGTGFDALMIRDADAGKDRLGKLSYVRAGVRNLGNNGTRARVTVDGQAWFEGRAACVLVGNIGRILGGFEVFPDARCDDGLLDIGVLTIQRRRDWLRLAARAVVGRIDSSPLVRITQGASAAVRLDQSMPWQLDGGDHPKAKKFDVTLLPGRQQICVPAT